MLKEKAGVIAGNIWNALNETEGMTAKQLKKATKLVDKDLFLGLGWLLREDKVSAEEVEGELFIKLIAVETNIHAGDAGVGRDGGGESDSGGL